MKKKSIARRAGMVLGFAAIGCMFVAQPAFAHAGAWSKDRSGCHYSGGITSTHGYAWTQKNSGDCSGHAYLRIYTTQGNPDVYWEGHAAGFISKGNACTAAGATACQVYHKSQSGESWGQSHY